jgi:DNA-binding protein HU-beta
MNKKQLIEAVALKGEMSKKDSEKAVETVFGCVEDALANGDDVRLVGHGTYEKKLVKGREGTCQIPTAQGQKWKTEDSYGVKFKAGKAFVDKLN